MEMNVGCLDRLARIFVGTTLFFLTFSNFIGVIGILGAIPIITGLSGMCPAYYLFGINTTCCDTPETH